MNGKKISVLLLTIGGIYFLLFHRSPFPINHEAIGLPPFHTVHAIFGVILLLIALYLAKKK